MYLLIFICFPNLTVTLKFHDIGPLCNFVLKLKGWPLSAAKRFIFRTCRNMPVTVCIFSSLWLYLKTVHKLYLCVIGDLTLQCIEVTIVLQLRKLCCIAPQSTTHSGAVLRTQDRFGGQVRRYWWVGAKIGSVEGQPFNEEVKLIVWLIFFIWLRYCNFNKSWIKL